MINVQFPPPTFRIRTEGGKRQIFDGIRKTWLALTEEEWVRQNFVAYLLTVVQYPSSLVSVEKEIMLNGLKKRFDILVYDSAHEPWMLVECKAPQVALSEAVLQQALRYNISVPVQYIIICNGQNTAGWEKSGSQLNPLAEMPLFQ